MLRTLLLAAVVLLSGCYPIWADVLVSIDKTSQEMSVFVDGTEQHRWPVSTGTRGYETPSGEFQASSMNEIWISKQWDNAPMPHSIFFTKEGHAIHGTNDTKNLGKAASHGCVRLAPENAATLYSLVEEQGLEATKVVLVGDYPTPEEEFPSRKPEPELEAQPDYPQQEDVEPQYDDPYGDYGRPAPPALQGVPDGFEFYGPGFQFQFKFERKKWKRERKWRRRWRD